MDDFNILLVDDEVDFLETMVKRLGRRNLKVITADRGEKALKILNEKNIDVIILDWKMPGLNGLDTLKEIKKINPLIEVIMLTGHANVEAGIEGMELGAFDYLMKPVDLDELLYKLQDAYKKKCLQEKKLNM